MKNCLLHVQNPVGERAPLATFVVEDGLFNEVVSHANFQQVDEVEVTDQKGHQCEMFRSQNEFWVEARVVPSK